MVYLKKNKIKFEQDSNPGPFDPIPDTLTTEL